jgi:selenocysteine lyase/cysteine desulfurase
MEEVGIERAGRHAASLTASLSDGLRALHHRDGSPAAIVYGPADSGDCASDCGATLAFNVLDADGDPIPFTDVEAAARVAGISVRGGCFCNPGASEAAFGFPADITAHCLTTAGVGGWTLERFAECMRGHAVGAVRASFGTPSNAGDVRRLVALVEQIACRQTIRRQQVSIRR